MGKRLEKTNLDEIIGKNITKERKLRNLTREELAGMMDLTPSHMGLIERGERGVTAINFSKLSNVFGIPVDRLFASTKASEIENNESIDAVKSASHNKIQSMAACLSVAQLNLVIHIIKGIITMDLFNKNSKQENIT